MSETMIQNTGVTAAEAMEVDEGVSPEDANFLESLPPDLRTIADSVLAVGSSDDAATRLEKLEVQLRKLILQRIRESRTDLGECWKAALQLCLHLVCMSEQEQQQPPQDEDSPDKERYKDLNARKIPFILLEDIFDCISADQCRTFWQDFVLGSYETIFGQQIWSPSPTQHPCWLSFLKITNKLIRRLPPKDSASVMLTLCKVYPLAERSGTRAWGSHNADNVTSFEPEDEFEEEQARLPTDSKMDEEGSVSDYSFYESFWKLQEDLNHPNVVDVASFLQRLKSLITALESHAVSTQKAKCEGSIKYLTSSHLLSYQLADPEFRIHILTQILIVCHHLSSAGPLFRTKLLDWQNRSKSLLKNIGPDGVKHLALLDSIVSGSEEAWRGWKKDKCQEDLDKRHSQPLTSRKRRRTLGGALGAAAAEEGEASQALTQGVLNTTELTAVSKQMRSVLPTMDTHLAEYIEALDPEAGIEAEYHPKNDKLFAWRALRVMSRDHFGYMQRVHVNGDFEGLVRHIYKEEKDMDIPGEYPDYEVEDFEEKEEEQQQQVEEEDVDDEKAETESVKDEPMEERVEEGVVDEPDKATDDAEEVLEVSTKEEPKETSVPETNGETKMEVDEEGGEEKKEPPSVPEESTADETEKPPPELSKDEQRKPERKEKPVETQQQDPSSPIASPIAEERPRLKFTPPPGKGKADWHPPAENGQKRRTDDAMDTNSGGRRARGGAPGRGDSRSRSGGPSDRGRNQPSTRGDRGPPPGRDDRRAAPNREDRRSPPDRRSPGRDDRGAASRGDRGPVPKGDPPRREDRGPPPRRDDHWVPPPGRGGHGRDDHRRSGGGGGRGGGGHRGDDRGVPPERWDDQRRPSRRDDRGDDRRDGDDRRGPSRRRHR